MTINRNLTGGEHLVPVQWQDSNWIPSVIVIPVEGTSARTLLPFQAAGRAVCPGSLAEFLGDCGRPVKQGPRNWVFRPDRIVGMRPRRRMSFPATRNQ